jgi:hypothetical protein
MKRLTIQYVEREASRLSGRCCRVFTIVRREFADPNNDVNAERQTWYVLSQRGDDGEMSVAYMRPSLEELLATIRQRAAA